MDKEQLEYADKCIEALHKSYPHFVKLSSAVGKFKGYQIVIDILIENGWIENSKSPYKLSKNALIEFSKYGSYSNYYKSELEKENQNKDKAQIDTEIALLEKENFEYLATIRKQESRIRDLEEKNKFIELLKSYWWVLITSVGIGFVIKELCDIIF